MATDSKVQVHNPAWVATEVAPELIGRDHELAEVTTALRAHPLVTLVGSGGIGKTSLAMATAYAVADQFTDGVYVVPLAEVNTQELLVLTLAKALDVRLQPAQPWAEQLVAHVQGKALLLVLDNFEQLIDWVEPISQMSRASRKMKFLVTSREKLGIPIEHAIGLQGMSLQPQNAAWSASELLFLHYARRVRPGFKLDGDDREHVQRICKLVDGMPLAIELAAAWVSLLPCRFIADQIQHNMDWLTTSVGFTHGQQKSVRAVLDYFWGMLSADERVCLQKLSVFSGGFERDLAQQVAGASLFFLSALVDRAYLSRTDAGRYFMHEMLKQYAAEKLNSDSDQKQAACRRHAEAYGAFAARTSKDLEGPEHVFWSARYEAEHNNFRAALAWLLGSGADPEGARRMATRLLGFWYQSGHLAEGRRWMKRAIDASAEETEALADVLTYMSFLASAQGDVENSRQSGLRSLAIYQNLNHAKGVSEALHNLAFNESTVGHYEEAIRLYEQHLAMKRACSDESHVAIALHNLAVAYQGLGGHDNLRRAADLYRESIVLSRAQGDPVDLAYTIAALPQVCFELDCVEETLPDFLEALQVFARSDDVPGSLGALETAALILEKHVAAVASEIWACSHMLHRKFQIGMDVHQTSRHLAATNRLRQHQGQDEFAAATVRGEAMSLAQALQLAHQHVALFLS